MRIKLSLLLLHPQLATETVYSLTGTLSQPCVNVWLFLLVLLLLYEAFVNLLDIACSKMLLLNSHKAFHYTATIAFADFSVIVPILIRYNAISQFYYINSLMSGLCSVHLKAISVRLSVL